MSRIVRIKRKPLPRIQRRTVPLTPSSPGNGNRTPLLGGCDFNVKIRTTEKDYTKSLKLKSCIPEDRNGNNNGCDNFKFCRTLNVVHTNNVKFNFCRILSACIKFSHRKEIRARIADTATSML
jgi:hypothetical protein